MEESSTRKVSQFPGTIASESLVSMLSRGDRQLPVFCPQCGTRIEIHKGLCGNRLIDAILLQAERIGTELECQRCDTRFVFQKLEEVAKRHRRQVLHVTR